jgi:hypothetical protein
MFLVKIGIYLPTSRHDATTQKNNIYNENIPEVVNEVCKLPCDCVKHQEPSTVGLIMVSTWCIYYSLSDPNWRTWDSNRLKDLMTQKSRGTNTNIWTIRKVIISLRSPMCSLVMIRTEPIKCVLWVLLQGNKQATMSHWGDNIALHYITLHCSDTTGCVFRVSLDLSEV